MAREVHSASDSTTKLADLLLLVTLLVGHAQFPAALGAATLDHIATIGR